MEKKLRIYLDTSVFGGCFDKEFQVDSLRLFDYVSMGFIKVLISPVVLEELESAPEIVKNILNSIPVEFIEILSLEDDVENLRNLYIQHGILSPKWIDDATHVALATVNLADAIVSWNFRHIVRLDKIKMFNQVNLLSGYGILTILSPKEVLRDEDSTE